MRKMKQQNVILKKPNEYRNDDAEKVTQSKKYDLLILLVEIPLCPV